MPAALALALVAALGAADAPSGRIVLTCPQTTWDAGDVPRGTVVAHDFPVRNESGFPVVLELIPMAHRPLENERLVEAGATERVRLALDTRPFRGKVTKTMVVTARAATAEDVARLGPARR